MRIKTATGKSYHVKWCAIGTLDGSLQFNVTGSNMTAVLGIFTDSSETAEIQKINDDRDGIAETFVGFTTFKGVELKPDGTITVKLIQG